MLKKFENPEKKIDLKDNHVMNEKGKKKNKKMLRIKWLIKKNISDPIKWDISYRSSSFGVKKKEIR